MPIDLPQLNSTKLDERPLVVSVAIDECGAIVVDGVTMEQKAMLAKVLAHAQPAGIAKIAFVTEPAR